jgi:RNA polymerase sigma-70 factor (ECF subfamily)
MEREDANPTRRSLVSRLRRWDDQASWEEFFNIYWRLIYSFALKAGLTDQEAEDVVQETVLGVAKKMADFHYDPKVCSFRGWLLHVTRLRIKDQLRKRLPAAARSIRSARATTTLERIPDPMGGELEVVWDEEWEKNIVDAAMARVKGRVRPEHYQMFYLNVVKEISAQKVAATFGVSAAQIYLVKHRVSRLIKSEVRKLERTGVTPASAI